MSINFIDLEKLRRQHTSNLLAPTNLKQRLFTKTTTLQSIPQVSSLKSLRIRAELAPIKSKNKLSDIHKIPRPLVSKHAHGWIEIYGGATYAGNKPCNEDRVVMINTYLDACSSLCSFFAVFDGFSGIMACNYLRDNLFQLITKSSYIGSNPAKAIADGFETAETNLLKIGSENDDNSGSCALVALVIDKIIYVGNLGSSRCIVSTLKGFEKTIVTNEHNLENSEEKIRILNSGAQVTEINGKLRIQPGNIAITRFFGCYKVKKVNKAINALPEILSTDITENMDCLVLVSDGI